MENQKNNAAKFAFFYMLSLVALIFMALSVGMIIFQIINKSIVDIINQYQGSFSPDQLKFAISALIISTPIYYFTSAQIHKNLFIGALGKDSGIRKWLTYFILFVASVVMIGWLIGLINTFLDGDLTVKFILKALTAIGISGAVFGFYFYDIKREEIEGKKNKVIQIYFYASLVVVIAAFTASLFFVESPSQTRNRKIDDMILNNFSMIDNAVSLYFHDFGQLPADLDILQKESEFLGEKDLQDPQIKGRFDYKTLDNNKYELCANFRTSNQDDDYKIDYWGGEQPP